MGDAPETDVMRALRLSRDTATNALEALAESGAQTLAAQCDADDLRSRLHLATARAESAEAAHAEAREEIADLIVSRDRAEHRHERLESAVEALADEWAHVQTHAYQVHANRLRALVGGAR